MYSVSEKILFFVRDNAPCTRVSIWEHLGLADYKNTDACINALLHENFLSRKRGNDDLYDLLSITPKGLGLLEELEEQAAKEKQRQAEQEAAESKRLQERHEDHAREERYHRSQNRVSIASAVIGSCLSFIFGLMVEHHAGIISALINIVHP